VSPFIIACGYGESTIGEILAQKSFNKSTGNSQRKRQKEKFFRLFLEYIAGPARNADIRIFRGWIETNRDVCRVFGSSPPQISPFGGENAKVLQEFG